MKESNIDSVLKAKASAELEEQIKKELEENHEEKSVAELLDGNKQRNRRDN